MPSDASISAKRQARQEARLQAHRSTVFRGTYVPSKHRVRVLLAKPAIAELPLPPPSDSRFLRIGNRVLARSRCTPGRHPIAQASCEVQKYSYLYFHPQRKYLATL